MAAPPRTSWLAPTAPTRRSLADVLRQTGGPPAPTWVRRDPPPAPAAAPAPPPPAPCEACAELAELQADLAIITARAEDAGRQAGLAETAALRARLAAAAAALEQAQAARTLATIDAIVEVALAVCSELAPAAATLDRSGVGALISEVVGVAGGQAVTLRAHPDDAAALAADLPEAVRVEPDPTLATGELRAAGARLVIDATWSTRLAALREPLVALLHARAEEAP